MLQARIEPKGHLRRQGDAAGQREPLRHVAEPEHSLVVLQGVIVLGKSGEQVVCRFRLPCNLPNEHRLGLFQQQPVEADQFRRQRLAIESGLASVNLGADPGLEEFVPLAESRLLNVLTARIGKLCGWQLECCKCIKHAFQFLRGQLLVSRQLLPGLWRGFAI